MSSTGKNPASAIASSPAVVDEPLGEVASESEEQEVFPLGELPNTVLARVTQVLPRKDLKTLSLASKDYRWICASELFHDVVIRQSPDAPTLTNFMKTNRANFAHIRSLDVFVDRFYKRHATSFPKALILALKTFTKLEELRLRFEPGRLGGPNRDALVGSLFDGVADSIPELDKLQCLSLHGHREIRVARPLPNICRLMEQCPNLKMLGVEFSREAAGVDFPGKVLKIASTKYQLRGLRISKLSFDHHDVQTVADMFPTLEGLVLEGEMKEMCRSEARERHCPMMDALTSYQHMKYLVLSLICHRFHRRWEPCFQFRTREQQAEKLFCKLPQLAVICFTGSKSEREGLLVFERGQDICAASSSPKADLVESMNFSEVKGRPNTTSPADSFVWTRYDEEWKKMVRFLRE